MWQSLIFLSNCLYTELQCQESLCCTVGVSSPIKALSIGCSVIKWFVVLTLKTTSCWWELHFYPGGESLWELTFFCCCCGTLVSLTQCNLPVFLRLSLSIAKAHLSFTVHILYKSLTHHLPAEEVTQIRPHSSSGTSHLQRDHPVHDLFYLLWLLYEILNDDLAERPAARQRHDMSAPKPMTFTFVTKSAPRQCQTLDPSAMSLQRHQNQHNL